MYAIIETGGKQYRVTPGQSIDVEQLTESEGNRVEIDRVLLIGDGAQVTVGTPVIEGAKVIAASQGTDRGKKITVFKYKRKIRYRKKTGHRQPYTRLTIEGIVGPEASQKEPKKRVRQRKKEVVSDGA